MALDRGDLSELNEIFKGMGGVDNIEEYTNTYEEIADGLYEGEVLNVEARNSKNTGRPMIDITLGLTEDRKEHVYLSLAGKDLKATQTAVARAVTQLKKLGVTGTELEDFINGAIELAGTRVSMKIETNGEFRNVDLTLA